MKRTRFTDEQIIHCPADAKCADLCRKHGMSEGTFYNWKAKFGGMTVSEEKRLKSLEDESAKLKKLLTNDRRRFGYPLAGRRFATQICREAAALRAAAARGRAFRHQPDLPRGRADGA